MRGPRFTAGRFLSPLARKSKSLARYDNSAERQSNLDKNNT